ncbi:hypothetical protein Pmani_036675 [Petrolisthes manimaculis]|uniref:Methyltransferase FkbM domain-containing protein n=1 Tax=Petrolisthes manimaculis TaxID=1843537 RepID=A0AAE1NJZ0_9EUCA|nr:hypothetical protein Pmani_036675 [Petrolisthes manimaculis]
MNDLLTFTNNTNHRTPEPDHRIPEDTHRTPEDGHRTSEDSNHRSPEAGHRTSEASNHRIPEASHRILEDSNHRISEASNHRTPEDGHRIPEADHRTLEDGHRIPEASHCTPEVGHRIPEAVDQPIHRTPEANHSTPEPNHRTPEANHRTTEPNHRIPEASHRTPEALDQQLSLLIHRYGQQQQQQQQQQQPSIHTNITQRLRNNFKLLVQLCLPTQIYKEWGWKHYTADMILRELIINSNNNNNHNNGERCNSTSSTASNLQELEDDVFNHLDLILRGPPAQDDPVLVRWVKSQLVAPSRLPYNLSYFLSGLHQEINYGSSSGSGGSYSPSQEFILGKIEELYGDEITRPGTFLEAGAYDGEFLSNTLYLEHEFGWRGLLVEANPDFFAQLLLKRRKSWALNMCLNTKPYPSLENFSVGSDSPEDINHHYDSTAPANPMLEKHISLGSSRLTQFNDNTTQTGDVMGVQCVPLYTIMKALGRTHIDFLSLDVEHAEMGILDTIPWDTISFRVMSIEHLTKDDLVIYMEERGYHHVASLHADHIFVNTKNTILHYKNKTLSDGDGGDDGGGGVGGVGGGGGGDSGGGGDTVEYDVDGNTDIFYNDLEKYGNTDTRRRKRRNNVFRETLAL